MSSRIDFDRGDLDLVVRLAVEMQGKAPGDTHWQKVQRLRAAGAVIIGKTHMTEFAFTAVGLNPHYPVPGNATNESLIPGGSSSGAGVSAAEGTCDIAIGSDTGGSIRAPAGFCGLIGLRTTHGRIPLDGAMPLAPSLDTFGWFARDIDVYETVAKVLLGFSPLEGEMGGSPEQVASGGAAGAPSTAAATLPSRGRGPAALRLAALDALVLSESEAAEYERMVDIAASVLGTPVAAPPLSHSPDDLYWCFRRIQGFEAWAAHGAWISTADRGLGPGVRERFDYGATIDGGTVAAETRRRDAFRAELTELLDADGVLVLPTVPGAAPLKDARFDDLQAWRERALKLLCWSGLSGFPQITLPLGQIDGAPFGLSLLGPAGSDLHLIDLGRTILEAAERA